MVGWWESTTFLHNPLLHMPLLRSFHYTEVYINTYPTVSVCIQILSNDDFLRELDRICTGFTFNSSFTFAV